MSKKILIVEDNAVNMYLITYILKKKGYTVVQAANGQMGLDLAQLERIDMVLMDIQLPDMDGLVVTRRLRKMPCCGTIPIIAVTSFAMFGDREQALAAGCNGYIEKPIDPLRFIDAVKEYC
ncbi:MAG: response regulator [ANME-2 cluster archaeon]|nr:response regulator [ANME-2 cluster archaeon]